MTERLYFTDSSLLEFTARVVAVDPTGEFLHVTLDQTAFYPTGGGQPHDTGMLNGLAVVDVIDSEDGSIVHVLRGGGASSEGGLTHGALVHGVVDHARRLDHLQQHSGQHILSQAFVQACGAETRSFHLGQESSTIDIELAEPAVEHMRAAEILANRVIFEDREMRVHLVSEQEAARLPLRKESKVEGTIRVIEVADFDWSACGGTHAIRTGQIGLIAIKSFERAKKMTRVEFLCGGRVLADYLKAHKTASEVARMFSVERESAPAMVEKVIQENKSLKKRTRALLEVSLKEEAAGLLGAAPSVAPWQPAGGAPERPGFRLVQAAFNERGPDEISILARRITEREPAVALLGTSDGTGVRLVFARSESLPFDVGALMRACCQALGGRGGGKSDMAQGGCPRVDDFDSLFARVAERLR